MGRILFGKTQNSINFLVVKIKNEENISKIIRKIHNMHTLTIEYNTPVFKFYGFRPETIDFHMLDT